MSWSMSSFDDDSLQRACVEGLLVDAGTVVVLVCGHRLCCKAVTLIDRSSYDLAKVNIHPSSFVVQRSAMAAAPAKLSHELYVAWQCWQALGITRTYHSMPSCQSLDQFPRAISGVRGYNVPLSDYLRDCLTVPCQ